MSPMTMHCRVIRTCSRCSLWCKPNVSGVLGLWAARRECSSQGRYTTRDKSRPNRTSPMDDKTHIACDDAVTSATLLTLDGLHRYREVCLRSLLHQNRTELQQLTAKITMCEAAARRYADRYTVLVFLLLTAEALILFYMVYVLFDWSLVEPITYLLGYAGVWAGIAYYSVMRRELTYTACREMLTARCRRRLLRKHNVDMKLHEKLQAEEQLLCRWLQGLEGL